MQNIRFYKLNKKRKRIPTHHFSYSIIFVTLYTEQVTHHIKKLEKTELRSLLHFRERKECFFFLKFSCIWLKSYDQYYFNVMTMHSLFLFSIYLCFLSMLHKCKYCFDKEYETSNVTNSSSIIRGHLVFASYSYGSLSPIVISYFPPVEISIHTVLILNLIINV